MMKKVRLEGKENAYPGELSGGQQQRVAIARSLAMQPDVMLFDEVTAALDPETVKEVLVTIKELAAEGMTCILVTHEMGFAREVADHIYFTDRGVIVEHGAPATFFDDAQDERTAVPQPNPVKIHNAHHGSDAPQERPDSLGTVQIPVKEPRFRIGKNDCQFISLSILRSTSSAPIRSAASRKNRSITSSSITCENYNPLPHSRESCHYAEVFTEDNCYNRPYKICTNCRC